MNTDAAARKILWAMLITLMVPTGLALAHGAPALTVMQPVVAAGGQVTLSGDGLGKDGNTVTLSLQGVTFQANLGTVTLKEDGFDNATFAIPRDVPPGAYVIRARNGQITATAQLEITAAAPGTMPMPSQGAPSPASAPRVPSSGGGGQPATMMPQVGQTTIVPEARSPVDRVLSIALVVLTAGVAVVLLWRNRSDLTRIDR